MPASISWVTYMKTVESEASSTEKDWFIFLRLVWTHFDFHHHKNVQGRLQKSDSPSVRRGILLPCSIIHTQNFFIWSELQDGFNTAEPSLFNITVKSSYTPWTFPITICSQLHHCMTRASLCIAQSAVCTEPFHLPMGTCSIFKPCPVLRELVFEATKDTQATPVSTAALFPGRSTVRWAPCGEALKRGTEHVVPNMFCFTLGL